MLKDEVLDRFIEQAREFEKVAGNPQMNQKQEVKEKPKTQLQLI